MDSLTPTQTDLLYLISAEDVAVWRYGHRIFYSTVVGGPFEVYRGESALLVLIAAGLVRINSTDDGKEFLALVRKRGKT